jgi:hypothetical protein
MAFYDPIHNNYYYNTYVPCIHSLSPSPSVRPSRTSIDCIYDYESITTSVTPPPSPRLHRTHPKKVKYIYEEYVPEQLRGSYLKNEIPIRESYKVNQKMYQDLDDQDLSNLNNSFAMRSDSKLNPLYPDLIYKNKLYKPVRSLSMDENYMNRRIKVEEEEDDEEFGFYNRLNDSKTNLAEKIREARFLNKCLFDDFKDNLFVEHRSRRRQRVSLRHKLKSIFRF